MEKGKRDDDPNLFCGYGIEVQLPDNDEYVFLKIRETLTRIGIADIHSNTLIQSVHILHKRGRYSILHFKELRAFDGKDSTITEDDIARRNTIVGLLEKWKLLTIIDKEKSQEPRLTNGVTVIPFKEKNKWTLKAKYSVGGKPKVLKRGA